MSLDPSSPHRPGPGGTPKNEPALDEKFYAELLGPYVPMRSLAERFAVDLEPQLGSKDPVAVTLKDLFQRTSEGLCFNTASEFLRNVDLPYVALGCKSPIFDDELKDRPLPFPDPQFTPLLNVTIPSKYGPLLGVNVEPSGRGTSGAAIFLTQTEDGRPWVAKDFREHPDFIGSEVSLEVMVNQIGAVLSGRPFALGSVNGSLAILTDIIAASEHNSLPKTVSPQADEKASLFRGSMTELLFRPDTGVPHWDGLISITGKWLPLDYGRMVSSSVLRPVLRRTFEELRDEAKETGTYTLRRFNEVFKKA